jgi:penicillin-binding protein 2
MLLASCHFSMKLGKAFSDSVIAERRQKMRVTQEEGGSWWVGMGRTLIFITILCIGFFILVWRLFDLAIMQGHHFRSLADGNRTRELIRHAPRGILLDRTGKPLVANIPYYRLLKPCTTEGADCVIPISRDEGDVLSKKGLPTGTFLEVDYRRNYLYSEALSHVLGYTGELTEKELNDEYYKLRYYRRGDRIGRTGAEALFEDRLRGRDGKELVEVDAHGTTLRTLGRDKETPGEDIMLSIDAGLQQTVAESFPKGEKGAIVVARPATGELLAMYSSPSYDLNAFSSGLSQQQYDDLTSDPDQPLFDRAIGGVYPPGSTFKIVTSLAALEEGVVSRNTIVDDIGVLTIGPFSFPNWYFKQYGKTEGPVDIVKAIQRSNDIFFYKAGEWVGITKLVSWARKVGVGKPLGVELGGEASGLMPDPAWKKERFGTPEDKEARNDEWYLGDTYHVAIGQGYLLVTPLQVNTWTNVIANGGAVCRPTIKKVTGTKPGETHCKDVVVKKETIDLIASGMRKACETGGTGYPFFDFGIRKLEGADKENQATSSGTLTRVPVACKTGTAEYGDPQNRTHAWFTAFAPLPAVASASKGEALKGSPEISGDPEISVTVLVEGAGEGSAVAAPIAKKILEWWFSR